MSKKIALTNMDIVWEDKEANKFQCEEMIKEAADEHADIILFPEMTLTGFSLRLKRWQIIMRRQLHIFRLLLQNIL